MRLAFGLLMLAMCVAATFVLVEIGSMTQPVGRISLFLLMLCGGGALYTFVKG